jgi:exodeoxyribonuclease VII small subunit
MDSSQGARVQNPLFDNRTFEEALAELEAIVRALEDGQTGLEDALARYESGVHLLKQCYRQLAQAEQRILQVTGVDGDGEAVTIPFDHTATADAGRPEARSRNSNDSGPIP